MTDLRPFWIDREYDRDRASDGRSRYGAYLRQAARSFEEIAEWGEDDASVRFARIAWRVATGPIMAPPLVRSHPRITEATLYRSNWNGEMIADVRLVSPRPAALSSATTAAGNWYRDQHRDSWDRYEGVGEEDLTRAAYLLTEARLLWQIPPGTLPAVKEVPSGHAALYRQAVECVAVLVGALNREVGPIIERLEDA